jgi:multiple sugar transport system permease protein
MKLISTVFFGTLVISICFAILYPVLTLLPMAFTDLRELGRPNSIWLPSVFGVNSFEFVFRSVMRGDATIMLKSLAYAASICFIQVFMSAMAGYALARVNFTGRNLIFFLVIFTFLVPRQSLLITQYLNFKHFDVFGLFHLILGHDIDLINKPVTLYLLAIFGFSVNQSLFVFIFRQFFLGMPKELEEASLIDGAGFYRTYFKIMFPNALPTILTVGILSFVWAYGDIYYTNYFNTDGPYFGVIIDKTFKDANNWYINNQARQWFDTATTNNLAFEALKQSSILTFLVPLLIIYFFVQRKIIENLDRAGIVG